MEDSKTFVFRNVQTPSKEQKPLKINVQTLVLYSIMAFGRTSNVESSPGKAPLLGSFPLDHDGKKVNVKDSLVNRN